MAQQKQQQKNSNTTFYTVMIVFLIALMVWAFTPLKIFESTWQAEQQQVIDYGGSRTNEWLLSQSMSKVSDFTKSGNSSEKSLGDNAFTSNSWSIERLYASIIWVNLIVYRAYILIMWVLLGMPFVAATAVDGFYTREINKESFISQSPIRHKMGVKLFHWLHAGVVAWLIIPWPMPFFIMPLTTIIIGSSLWFWISNLQKRL